MTTDTLTTNLNVLRAALAAAPANESSRLRLGQALVQAGEHSTAQDVILPLANTGNAELWMQARSLLALVAEQTGRLDESCAHWETLLAVDIDDPLARAHLARLQRLPLAPAPAARTPFIKTNATLLSPEGVVAARYEILSQLGSGATGSVYLARDAHLDLQVALKVLHPFLGATVRSDARQRFFREARLAAALRHAGVVAVYDLDETTRTLSLEYLPMGTLRDRTSDPVACPENRLPPVELYATLRALLATLEHVHGTGLIHGDIKPRNILLRRPGEPVLGDFGVARLLGNEPAASAESGGGTPLYFAPEQLRGATSNISTDLFAVGAVAWELAVGRTMRTRTDLTLGRFEAPPMPEPLATLGAFAKNVARFIAATTATSPHERPNNAHAALHLLEG